MNTEQDTEAWAYRMLALAHPHEAYDMDPDRFWLFFQRERPGVTREQMIAALIASGDESD